MTASYRYDDRYSESLMSFVYTKVEQKIDIIRQISSFLADLAEFERSEESRVHQVGVTEILRYAMDDKMIA